MPLNYNKNLVSNARALRKNMTDEEKHLWYDFLKKLPITVNRQKNIGNYIVDFYISSANIVIEIDGIQHEMEENKLSDKKRDKYLEDLGIKVLRYSNISINESFSVVCDDILLHLNIEV
jgi:very-short-patch-repair endonuclease